LQQVTIDHVGGAVSEPKKAAAKGRTKGKLRTKVGVMRQMAIKGIHKVAMAMAADLTLDIKQDIQDQALPFL
jgi:hypothetical protein